ncbi:phage portal protein [Methylomonas sp. HYX-M1]|uniref:phage portal protein n=1 Tax=Methylomonas sp. HYX-M1 TaxID=3139307 RepID=UPI00345BE9D7
MKQHPFDRLIGFFAPQAAVKRLAARNILAYYEAAKPSKLRKFARDKSAPDVWVQRGAAALRDQARDKCANHDLARGILRKLVNNTVGPQGIGIEPQPRRADGTIHEEYAKALRDAWRDWQRRPEVTWKHTWARSQRLMAATWFRDGEAFAQMLSGPIASLDHGTRIPFSLELFEPDMVPLEYSDGGRIRQGIERNGWGRRVAYHVFKQHPGDLYGSFSSLTASRSDMRRIDASRMLHIAALDRMHQLRGVSEFAAVLTRLEDIKDYEESERIAAKIAAMLTAYVKRGTPDMFDPDKVAHDENGKALPPDIRLSAGAIITDLGIGEEIGLIDSKRPNPNLIGYRQGQLRAVAAGMPAGSYSSISRDYSGTYSAQRQELVESWIDYAVLTDDFTGQCVQPVWEAFVNVAHLSGIVKRPADVLPESADDALYIAMAMPWIDPLKEALAWHQLVQDGFAAEVEVMRRRGVNPRDVLEQMDSWRIAVKDKGLVLSSDYANEQGVAQPANDRGDGSSEAAVNAVLKQRLGKWLHELGDEQ